MVKSTERRERIEKKERNCGGFTHRDLEKGGGIAQCEYTKKPIPGGGTLLRDQKWILGMIIFPRILRKRTHAKSQVRKSNGNFLKRCWGWEVLTSHGPDEGNLPTGDTWGTGKKRKEGGTGECHL